MASDVSISTACFIYKKSKKRNSKAAETLQSANVSLFRDEWQAIEHYIEFQHVDAYGEVLKCLLKFVKESLCAGMYHLRIIPTAVLVTGVNLPDHNAVFSSLKQSVVGAVSPHVALLTSNDAPNIKVFISSFVRMVLETSEDDETVERNRRDMIALSDWYANRLRESEPMRRRSSPSKKPKYDGTVKKRFDLPVVIVLKDIEAFQSNVLQHFIAILSEYVDRIPFVLIFGVSTSTSTVYNILNQSSLSKLAIETFQSQPPSSYLDVVLRKVLIGDKFPFKLGHRVFSLLEDVFLFNDLSVKTFLSGIKFCMMDHYYSNAFSTLCCSSDSLEDRIDRLKGADLEEIRKLPSFRVYVEKQHRKNQKLLLLDDQHLKFVTRQLVSDLHSYHSEFFPMLHCIHGIVCALPKYPLGKQLRQIYGVCLERELVETEEFENSMKLLNLMARDELIAHLKKGCTAFEDCGFVPSTVSEVKQSLADVVNRLEAGDELLLQSDKKASFERIDLPKKIDRSALQQKLKELSWNKRPISSYFALREEATSILKEAAKKFLKSPRHYPLHEIFYYDSIKAVRLHWIGESRSAMQIALSDPNSYFACDCCSLDNEESIPSSFPDICISFKLHLECGRLINLYDWLQAFLMISEQAKISKSVSKKNKIGPDKELMARFIRSVAELQFLGFIKGTVRKTDHVLRLTW